MLASKIENISLSGTMEIAAKTIELKSKGIDVIDLCVGEPDLPTPAHIKQAGLDAINSDKTKYTLNTGITELRHAISKKYLDEYGANYSPDEIIVSNGAKQSIYNALQSVINEGNEVLIPLPYYVSYPHMVKLAGGIPVFVETKKENFFKPTSEDLIVKIGPKTKAVILCNPNNPTGAVFTKEELISVVQASVEKNLIIICDEIYEKLMYESMPFTSVANLGEKFKEHLIIVNGVSKTYAMTGWRIGYALAPKNIVNGMSKLQSHSTSAACSISQYASYAALVAQQQCVEEQRKIFEKRRNYIINFFSEIELIDFIKPFGAFYFFVDINKIIVKNNSINNSSDFVNRLLDEANVATVAGDVFGIDGYIRISYAKSMEEIKEAMLRIKKFIQQLD
ncbi:MAG: pyridoxal phosphate-dependent aminotransferase [Ignavibacteriae bacterium]|nr:pyridoxal phosphate-dependent aminotransferase [Ignavibacteriota bacterium]